MIAAAGAVGRGADGDVVDGAVEGEVDGFGGVGAVVGEELGVGEGDGAGLGVSVLARLWMLKKTRGERESVCG